MGKRRDMWNIFPLVLLNQLNYIFMNITDEIEPNDFFSSNSNFQWLRKSKILYIHIYPCLSDCLSISPFLLPFHLPSLSFFFSFIRSSGLFPHSAPGSKSEIRASELWVHHWAEISVLGLSWFVAGIPFLSCQMVFSSLCLVYIPLFVRIPTCNNGLGSTLMSSLQLPCYTDSESVPNWSSLRLRLEHTNLGM